MRSVTCDSCKRRSTNLESFNDLSVDIPPADWEKRKQARRLPQPQLHATPADLHKSSQAQAEDRKSALEKDKVQEEEKEEHPLKVRSRDRAAAQAVVGGEMCVGGALGVMANLAGER